MQGKKKMFKLSFRFQREAKTQELVATPTNSRESRFQADVTSTERGQVT